MKTTTAPDNAGTPETGTPETGTPRAGIAHGLISHLMVVTHYVMKATLDKLSDTGCYPKLSMTYERYIPVLVEGRLSPGELAARVGTSKQACSKVIKELEKLQLIVRRQNPDDGRSTLLELSGKGLQLLQDGTRVTTEVQRQLADQVGEQQMDQLVELLEQTCRGLGVQLRTYPALQQTSENNGSGRPVRLNILLQTLTNHLRETLLQEMNDKGFTGLRTNLGQILGMISREPRRIQYIASVIGISKQAVAVTSTELENQGYVIRERDPDDKRQIFLRLSPLGESLIQESIASVRAQEAGVKNLLGEEAYRQLTSTLEKLYHFVSFQLEDTPIAPEKLQKLTDLLLQELGVAGVRTMAQHLLTITRGNA